MTDESPSEAMNPAAKAQRGASPQKPSLWTMVILACVSAALFAVLIAQIMPMLSTTLGGPKHFFPEKIMLLEKQSTQSGGYRQ